MTPCTLAAIQASISEWRELVACRRIAGERRPFHPRGHSRTPPARDGRNLRPTTAITSMPTPGSNGADRTAIYDKFSAVDRPCAIRSQIGNKVGDFGRLRPAADWNAAESFKD